MVHTVIKTPTISDITLQHPENYNQVQADKDLMKDIEVITLTLEKYPAHLFVESDKRNPQRLVLV